MPHLNMQEIASQLSPEFKRALKSTLEKEIGDNNLDVNQFFNTLKKELGSSCSSNSFVTEVCVWE